jgi:hypothetical protein
MSIQIALLALLASPLAMALPSLEADTNSTLSARQSCEYSGTWDNFPSQSQWLPWGEVFNNYEQYMVDAGSSWDDVGRISVAIEQAAAAIGVEELVILGIILQESSGYVGAPCTPTGGDDCGLMQSEGCPGYPYQNELPQVGPNLSSFTVYSY